MKFILILLTISTMINANDYISKSTIDKVEHKYNSKAKKRFITLNNNLRDELPKDELIKIKKVNDYFNKVGYSTDISLYNQKDYWATPNEFLAKNLGDCEDYVIAKYFALRYLGLNTSKLYFTYVRSTKFNTPHMVLTYFETPDSIPLVLDNNKFEILPATKREDLKPIYYFNGELMKKKKHKKWDQLLENIKRDKI
ncbi:MAG: hypothetical protein GQ570_09725 [Helicobacteraceae bacterium]|nr:hypothetical protein [Helicobacteraceae bacterium]